MQNSKDYIERPCFKRTHTPHTPKKARVSERAKWRFIGLCAVVCYRGTAAVKSGH